MKNFIPKHQIGVGGFEFGELEKKYLNQVIASNRLSYGPWSQKFEKLFAGEHQCSFGIFSNSGTSALQMALAAMKEKYNWKDGDEVLVPAVTFIASSNVVLFNDLKPVFVDVDSRTYNIDPSKIEQAITERTKAIMPVHLCGLPCDMDPIIALAKKYSLRIIEDSCETMFASYKGKKIGSFGDVGCFSTYAAHILVTGVGGLSLTNDPELAVIMRSYMNHGRDSIYLSIDDDQNVSGEQLKMIIAKRFSFIRLGHSMRCTEFEAALGVAQLEQKDTLLTKRREIAKSFSEGLQDLQDYLQLPHIPHDRDHQFMMYPIVIKKGSKTDIMNYLEERNIETRELLPLTNQPVYQKKFGERLESRFPVAEWLNKNAFYIGCHPQISSEEIDYVVNVFHEYFKI